MLQTVNHKNPGTFPSKILLLGEYGILKGSAALAIPYPVFSGKLCLPGKIEKSGENERILKSNKQLFDLYNYLKLVQNRVNFLRLPALKEDLESGLWFNANIPENYGLGSSGALTAALFDRYATSKSKELPLPEIRQNLAFIEKYFHGTSSGVDPLVSLLNKPVYINTNEEILLPGENIISGFTGGSHQEKSGFSLFLVDSKIPVNTGPLVQWYLKAYEQPEFRRASENIYFPAIHNAIEALLTGDSTSFLSGIAKISAFQKQFLTPLILPHFIEHVNHGLATGEFFLKLFGSGGGGYMLGFTQNISRTKNYFAENGLEVSFINEKQKNKSINKQI